jgi:hypothetical protein
MVMSGKHSGPPKFKPIQGLRYVEELELDGWTYILERDGERPVRYQQIKG